MNEKFTKGQWEVKRTIISEFRVKVKDRKGKQGKVIGDVRNSDNANLIAAAPEMYKTLRAILRDDIKGVEMCLVIESVLAKARGES